MNHSLLRKGVSAALALALGLSALPYAALAAENDGLCQHHPVHTENCGFENFGICGHLCSSDNGCITVRCVHTHVETCFSTDGKLNCSHACTSNEACYTPTTDCLHHTHGGCGHHEGKDCDLAVNGCEECEQEGELTQIKGTDVTIEGYSFPYTGEEIRPTITVKVGDTVLTEGKHYSAVYENNIQVGSASVTVTGLEEGGYQGIVTIPFVIEAAPEETQPEETRPEVTEPEESVPETTVPEETVPETTVPETTEPEETIPETTVPETTVPETTVPEETEPEQPQPEETKPVEYKITKGNGKIWYQNSGKTLSFTIKADADDFTGITVGGKKLDSQYYTLKDDLTVTLKDSFLKKLTVGKYKILFQFTDGEAAGTFSVSDQYDETNPTTGDSIGVVFGVMLTSLIALGGCALVYRKKFTR